ncbi:integrase [Methylobacterium sp. OAE515]|uniref:tyrosine-type recombinase/integrase n=1 Tax=Methylobacterium sp. OAE515 TaxID=2817895 RepID=UPI00178A39EB
MPEYRLQRLRGGWSIAAYEDGKRVSRRRLECSDAAGAAAEFSRIVAEAERPVDPDVRTIWNAYVADKAGRRIAENMGWTGRAVLPFFGDLKPDAISEKTCRAYVATRRSAKRGSAAQQARLEAAGKPPALGVADGTIRTELNQLRAALLWAEKRRMIGRAPAIEMPSAPVARERHLTRREFERLLDASETPHLRLYLLLAISTAGRNAALLELTWDRVDFERGLVFLGPRHVLRPQKGRATVPMTNALRAALSDALAYRRGDRVITWAGEPVASVRTALGKAVKRAGLPKVTPHMLRHSAAVWMAEDGVRMEEIAAYLGHADAIITQRVYARFSPAHLRKAAGSLEVGGPRPAG